SRLDIIFSDLENSRRSALLSRLAFSSERNCICITERGTTAQESRPTQNFWRPCTRSNFFLCPELRNPRNSGHEISKKGDAARRPLFASECKRILTLIDTSFSSQAKASGSLPTPLVTVATSTAAPLLKPSTIIDALRAPTFNPLGL